MSKVQGIDVSHWNNKQQINKYIEQSKPKFLFAKASQGKTYKDNTFGYWMTICEKYGLEKGAYHFATPNKNSAKVEAENFLNAIRSSINSSERMLLALDWEADALKYRGWSADWAYEFLERVYRETGIKPLMYMSESSIKGFKNVGGQKVPANDYGLWVAKWSGKPKADAILPWKFHAFHQYTSSPFDKDEFNGGIEQLRKYATPVK